MGDLDGSVLVLGRHVRQLRGGPGSRQVHAGGHTRAGLPAAARGPAARLHEASAQDPGKPRPRLAPRYNAAGTEEWARFEPGRPTPAAIERAARAVEGRPELEEDEPCLTPRPGADRPGHQRGARGDGHRDRARARPRDPDRRSRARHRRPPFPAGRRRPALHVPLEPARGRLPPATPRFAVHYELLNRDRVERINVKALLPDPAAGTAPGSTPTDHCPRSTPASSSSRRPSSRSGLRLLRDRLQEPPGPAAHPDAEDYVGWPQRRDFPVGGEPVLFTHNEIEMPRWYE